MENEGVTKSAILLMSLGEDEAAEVFKHLSPRDVQKISAAMATLKGVSRDDVEGIIGEFCNQAGDGGGLGAASSDWGLASATSPPHE
jgi:flagellar motor switch protein FliG